MDNFSSRRLPYNQLTIIRVPTVAVNIDVKIPIDRVTAKPFTEPDPIANNTIATSKVVRFESKMVAKAFS